MRPICPKTSDSSWNVAGADGISFKAVWAVMIHTVPCDLRQTNAIYHKSRSFLEARILMFLIKIVNQNVFKHGVTVWHGRSSLLWPPIKSQTRPENADMVGGSGSEQHLLWEESVSSLGAKKFGVLISEIVASQFENNVGELLSHYLWPKSNFAPSFCAIKVCNRPFEARVIHSYSRSKFQGKAAISLNCACRLEYLKIDGHQKMMIHFFHTICTAAK